MTYIRDPSLPPTSTEARIDAIADERGAALDAIKDAYERMKVDFFVIRQHTEGKTLTDRLDNHAEDFACLMDDVLADAAVAADPARIAEELDGEE